MGLADHRGHERGTHGSLQGGVSGHIEIPAFLHRNTPVDNGAIFDITVVLSVRFFYASREESCVMIFAHDEKGDLGVFSVFEDLLACRPNGWYLNAANSRILALGYA